MVADGWCVCVRLHCALCMGNLAYGLEGCPLFKGL